MVAARAAQVLERERGHLQRLTSFRGLVRRRGALVQRDALRYVGPMEVAIDMALDHVTSFLTA